MRLALKGRKCYKEEAILSGVYGRRESFDSFASVLLAGTRNSESSLHIHITYRVCVVFLVCFLSSNFRKSPDDETVSF